MRGDDAPPSKKGGGGLVGSDTITQLSFSALSLTLSHVGAFVSPIGSLIFVLTQRVRGSGRADEIYFVCSRPLPSWRGCP